MKDNTAFIARKNADVQAKKDEVRKRKVKELMGMLENQEGEVRKNKKVKYKLFD